MVVVDLDSRVSLQNYVTFPICITKWDYKKTYPDPAGVFDMVWASVDCSNYSQLRQLFDSDPDLAHADMLVRVTMDIISYFKPRVWYIENPVGGACTLDKRNIIPSECLTRTSYCKLGYDYQKNTGIWSNDKNLDLPPPCSKKSPCNHKLNSGLPYHARAIVVKSRANVKNNMQRNVQTEKERSSVPQLLLDCLSW
jgi:hypothetical protein